MLHGGLPNGFWYDEISPLRTEDCRVGSDSVRASARPEYAGTPKQSLNAAPRRVGPRLRSSSHGSAPGLRTRANGSAIGGTRGGVVHHARQGRFGPVCVKEA